MLNGGLEHRSRSLAASLADLQRRAEELAVERESFERVREHELRALPARTAEAGAVLAELKAVERRQQARYAELVAAAAGRVGGRSDGM